MDKIRMNDLTKIRSLGKSGYAEVHHCRFKSGKNIAVKCISTGNINNNAEETKEVKKFNEGINELKKIRHERILEYYGASCTLANINIFMEFMDGGSLYDKIIKDNGLDETTASEKSIQILGGLEFLDRKNFAHMNIKSSNILLDSKGNCKIADFNVSAQLQKLRSGSQTLPKPYWTSPEVIRGDVGIIKYEGFEFGIKADIWSFGCTVLEMLTKEPPWSSLDYPNAILKITSNEAIPHLPDNISALCQTFLNDCFQRDPALRPNALQLLSYDWVKR